MRPHDSMRNHPISTIYVLVLIICLRAGSANAAGPSTIRVGYPQLNGGQIPEQPDVSKRAAARYLATKDQEIIDEAYKGFAPLFPKIPYVTDEAIRSALSVTDHPKASSANPKDFYDNRFLQELESSGFVKELYAAK